MPMSESSSLPILPVAAGNNPAPAGRAKTAVDGPNGGPADNSPPAEGSFLEFLNAFNALSDAQHQAENVLANSGIPLPPATPVANTGRPALTSPGTMPSLVNGAQPGLAAASLAARDQLTQVSGAVADHAVEQQSLAAQSPSLGTGSTTISGAPESSTAVSSAALASRLAAMTNPGLAMKDTATTAPSPDNKTATLAAAMMSDTALQAKTSPQLAASAAQLDPRTAGTDKPTLNRATLSASRTTSTVQANTATESALSTSKLVEADTTEANLFSNAQLKKMSLEQQIMTAEKSLLPGAAGAAANTTSHDPASASSVRLAPTQFAMMADSSVSTTHQATVTETFGKPDWNQGMGKQVVWMANQNIRSAEIRLNPAHLGPIEVRIEMEDDQVSLAFSSRHAVVREAVEQAMPRLREMFEESGLNLADTDVSQQSFAEQRSHESAENTKHRAQSASGQADPAPGEISAETATTQLINNGLVDYYI
jgi:flagellar hook-length control protein FliK